MADAGRNICSQDRAEVQPAVFELTCNRQHSLSESQSKMSSTHKNSSFSNKNKNRKYYANHAQEFAEQDHQPTRSFSADRGTQLYQPKYEQIEKDLSSSSSDTCIYPAFSVKSESLDVNPSDTVDSSLISETEYFVQDSSLICKTEYFMQESIPTLRDGRCSNNYLVVERSPDVKIENFSDDLDCTSSISSYQVGEPYSTSHTPSTKKSQLDITNSQRQIKSKSLMKKPIKLGNINGAKKQQRNTRTKCTCPNCNAGANKKVRDSRGRLLHRCHYSYCGKEFNYTTDLKRHLDWHTGKKNFVCLHCNKNFLLKSNLSKHIKSHIDDGSEHVCHIKQCGKVFKRIEYLRKHLLTYHSKKPLFCAHCNQKFSRRDTLIKHIRRHFNTIPKSKRKL